MANDANGRETIEVPSPEIGNLPSAVKLHVRLGKADEQIHHSCHSCGERRCFYNHQRIDITLRVLRVTMDINMSFSADV